MIARNSLLITNSLTEIGKWKMQIKKFIFLEKKLTSASNSNISGAPCSVYATIHVKIPLNIQGYAQKTRLKRRLKTL